MSSPFLMKPLDKREVDWNNKKDVMKHLKYLSPGLRDIEDKPDWCKDDYDIGLLIVEFPTSFKYLSERLRGLKPLVLKAVKVDGCVLEHASEDLKNDTDIVSAAIKSDSLTLRFANVRFLSDRYYVKKAIESSFNIFRHLPLSFQRDLELFELAVKQHFCAYIDMAEELKADLDVIEILLKYDDRHNGSFLHIPENLRSNKDFLKKLLSRNGLWLKFLTEKDKDDEELVKIAMNQNILAFAFISDRLLGLKTLAYKAVEGNPFLYNKLPKHLKKDKDIKNLYDLKSKTDDLYTEYQNATYSYWDWAVFAEISKVVRNIDKSPIV